MNFDFAVSAARPLILQDRCESGHSGSAALCQEQTHAAQQVGDERPAKQRSETRAHY